MKNKLILEYNHNFNKGRTMWKLNKEFSLASTLVPAGFHTDGTTVPRLFWIFLSPTGRTMPAAIIHDFLIYNIEDGKSRKSADDKFLEAMTELNIATTKKYFIYSIVRCFGILKTVFNKHNRSK